MLSCIVFGSSGATGRELIDHLSRSQGWKNVFVVTRRMIPSFDALATDPKFKFIVLDNIMDEQKIKEEVSTHSIDAVFNLLGTRVNVGEEQFRRIDKEYVLRSAELARELKARQFSHITCKGNSANSMFLYMRVKGEVEAELAKVQLPNISVFKPGLLIGRDNDSRFGEKVASCIPFIDKITTQNLAKAILNEAEANLLDNRTNGYKTYSHKECENLAK